LSTIHVSCKRDHCIWFAHLPSELASELERLTPGQSVSLSVDGHLTLWQRMRPGSGKPTPGLRIESGKEVWNEIPFGQSFALELIQTSDASKGLGAPPAEQLVQSLLPRGGSRGALFSAYLFVDYSGASSVANQRKTIKIAYGEGHQPAAVIDGRFDRDSIVEFIVVRLKSASTRGLRVCLGLDHMYGIPQGLAREIGLSEADWRSSLGSFLDGAYHPDAPPVVSPEQFGRELNRWLSNRGRLPYFWSATKATKYGIPRTDPRASGSEAWRLTDRCKNVSGRGSPMPFNRLGDPGTVGGQSLFGMRKLREVMTACKQVDVRLRFWPFDGLDLSGPEYADAHVALEPYPSALRPPDVPQTDANDALHSARTVQHEDLNGNLGDLCDLSRLSLSQIDTVKFEGWIFGNLPETQAARSSSEEQNSSAEGFPYPFPTFLSPILHILADNNEHRAEDVREQIAAQFDLTPEQRSLRRAGYNVTVLANKVALALNRLVFHKAISGRAGSYRITSHGLDILKKRPSGAREEDLRGRPT